MKIRVYYEDTDAGGIVYHTKYINFCERARSDIFFSRGMMPGEGDKNGFVVKHIDADFQRSAKLGDLLEVENTLISQKRTSLLLSQKIYKDNMLLFKMEVLLVYMEYGKICRIPEHLSSLFETL